jgi:hypothetical protein
MATRAFALLAAARPRRLACRPAVWLLAAALLLPGADPVASAEAETEDPYSGTYDVTGLTVDQKTGDTRRVDGHVVLTKKNGHWAVASELETDFPTPGGALRTDVIGTGEGRLVGGKLAGTTQTQLVIQTVPGVDTDFAFIPREVGPRLVSSWTAWIDADGTMKAEISNRGEEGEVYSPTKTTLRGKRVTMPKHAPRAAD